MPKRTLSGRGPAQGRARRPYGARANQVFLVLAAGLVLIGVRLAWLQVVQAGELTRAAADQRTRDLKLSPRRGAIYDREGKPLAVTSDAKDIYADPTAIEDATSTADAVAHVLGGEASTYLTKLTKQNTHFVYLGRKVALQRADALAKLEITGIGMIDSSMRTYPGGTLACQVLGFVNVDDQGRSGLELQYESTLAGTPGRIVAERDTQGHLIPGGIVTAEQPVDGQDIYLTIDADVQYKAQEELAKAVEKYGAKSGSVVVMDPRNGEILAIASTPYFDPNEYSDATQDAMRNKAICDVYEPGSTIKSFTAAAAIDSGLYTPTSMFHLPATLKVGDRTIHEAHRTSAVDYSLTQIVTESSNVGAVIIGQKLGASRLLEYFSRFGLSRRTGVDYPGEARGYTPSLESFSQSTLGNLPFGQGLSVTPLQLARGLAAIANGGTLVTPHFLYRQSSAVATFPANPEPVISHEAATLSTIMLTDVVRRGTGTSAKVSGYEVSGKTGTAQKARPGGGGYLSGTYVGSFVGYLPAGDPQILIVVTIDSPKSGIYGGTVAGPAFREIANFCVAHLRIAPAATVGDIVMPDSGNGTVSGQGSGTTGTVESTSSGR